MCVRVLCPDFGGRVFVIKTSVTHVWRPRFETPWQPLVGREKYVFLKYPAHDFYLSLSEIG